MQCQGTEGILCYRDPFRDATDAAGIICGMLGTSFVTTILVPNFTADHTKLILILDAYAGSP